MKRFKQYITYLNEGVGQVKKEYLKTGKIDQTEFDQIMFTMNFHFSKNKKLINKYVRWFTNNYLFMKGQSHFYDLNQPKDDPALNQIFDALMLYELLVVHKAVKKMPPVKLIPPQLYFWIQDQSREAAKKKKFKPKTSNDKWELSFRGEGFEIFQCKHKDAIIDIGAPGDWCIRRKNEHYTQYIKEGYCFYVMIDHHRYKKDAYGEDELFRKVCIQINENDHVTIFWDMEDNNYELDDLKQYMPNIGEFYTALPDELIKAIDDLDYFEPDEKEEAENTQTQYIEEVAEEYYNLNSAIEACIEDIKQLEDTFFNEIKYNARQKVKELLDTIKTLEKEKDQYDEEDFEELITDYQGQIEKIEYLLDDRNFFRSEELFNIVDDYNMEYSTAHHEATESIYFPSLSSYDQLAEWWRDNSISEEQVKDAIWVRIKEGDSYQWDDLPVPNGHIHD